MNSTIFREMLEGFGTFYKAYKKVDKPMVKSWYDALKGNQYTDGDVIKAVSSIRDDDTVTEFPSLNQFRREVETQKRKRLGPPRDHAKPVNAYEPNPAIRSESAACFRAIMKGITYGKHAGVKAMTAVADKYPGNQAGIMRCAHEIGAWEEIANGVRKASQKAGN